MVKFLGFVSPSATVMVATYGCSGVDAQPYDGIAGGGTVVAGGGNAGGGGSPSGAGGSAVGGNTGSSYVVSMLQSPVAGPPTKVADVAKPFASCQTEICPGR